MLCGLLRKKWRLPVAASAYWSTETMIAYIRLFCNFGAPEYHVVVGTWNEGR